MGYNKERKAIERNQENRKVGIALDMTKKEREEKRKLREKLHRRREEEGKWMIKRGNIVNIDTHQHWQVKSSKIKNNNINKDKNNKELELKLLNIQGLTQPKRSGKVTRPLKKYILIT